MKKFLLPVSLFCLCSAMTFGQRVEKVDTAVISKIRSEGMKRSQVMDLLHMLTDVHGPRLTNSTGFRNAAEYSRQTLTKFGLVNVHFDEWDEAFGRGWNLKKFTLQNLEPVYSPLIAYPKAWSPGIKGTQRAEAVYLDIQSEDDIRKYQGKLKGKFVLFSLPTPVKPGFAPDATRLVDSVLLQMANSSASESFSGRRFRAPTEPQRLAYLKWDLCQKEGALAVLEASPASRLEDGTVAVSGATVPYPADVPYAQRVTSFNAKAPRILPQVVVAAEHYNRMVRQILNGRTVKLEMALETEFLPEAPGFNVIGEIPGTDLKDEVIMIGAHLDSWHSGTGTTDNACGSAVMMEAMRLIKSLGINPRRTIRIALWGGEEQGLLGSRNYVKRVLGERLDKSFPYDSLQLKPAAEKLSVYFNMDNGSGKYRGIYMQGNSNIAPVFRAWFKPFEKAGASTLTLRNTSGTDHLSFDALGIPAFQFIQDPIEYGTRTHHTSMDLYDKAVEDDLKHNAIITAVFAWLAANRDELMPRK